MNEKTVKKPQKQMNFLQRYFFKRKFMKKRKRFFNAKIGKERYEPFLKEVDKALGDLMQQIPDSTLFLDRMGEETTRWLNDMPDINLASFKAGACYGIFTYCRAQKAKAGKKESYIS